MRLKTYYVCIFFSIALAVPSHAKHAEQCQRLLNTKENGEYKYWKGMLSSTLRDYTKTRRDVETFYFNMFSQEPDLKGSSHWRERCFEEVNDIISLNQKSWKKKFLASSSAMCLQVLSAYCNRGVTIGNTTNGEDSVPSRRLLRKAMVSGSFKANMCYPSEWLKNIKDIEFEGLGKSPTEVALAQTSVDPLAKVALKIAPEQTYDNGLEIERGFYRNYFDTILSNYFSPHVVAYYNDLSCDKKDFIDHSVGAPLQKVLAKRWPIKDPGEHIKADSLKILISEQTSGRTLRKYLDKERVGTEDFRSILFQIIYTLEVFNRLGMRHNDAHDQNIVVEIKDKPFTSIYAVDQQHVFAITTNKMVKIFDLDHASATCDKTLFHPSYGGLIDALTTENLCLTTETQLTGKDPVTGQEKSNCLNAGRCNDRNIYYDTHLALTRLHKASFMTTHEYIDFLKRNISERLLYTPFLSYYPLEETQVFSLSGKSQKPPKNKVSYIPKSDKEMKTPLDMLKDEYFAPFRIEPGQLTLQCERTPIFHLPLTVSQPLDYWATLIPEKCLVGLPEPGM